MIIIYIILLIFSFLFYVYVDSDFTIYLPIILILLPIFSFVISIIQKKFITIAIESEKKTIFEDKKSAINLLLSNKSIIPVPKCTIQCSYLDKFTKESGKFMIKTSLYPKSEQTISVPINFKHCGVYEISVDKLFFYDFLSLFKRRVRAQLKTLSIIPPKTVPLEIEVVKNPYLMGDSDVFDKNKSGDDPSEVFNIREYTPGDKVNRIHWKMSTKEDNVYIKEFSRPIFVSTVFLLDISLKKGDTLEKIDCLMSSLISLCAAMLEQNTPFFVAWGTNDGAEIVSVYNFDELVLIPQMIMSSSISESSVTIIENFIEANESMGISHIIYLSNKISDATLSGIDFYGNLSMLTLISTDYTVVSDDEKITSIKLNCGEIESSLNNIRI